MPIIKISLSDDEYTQVLKMLGADEMTSKMSIQDFIRYKILGKSNPDIVTPEEPNDDAKESIIEKIINFIKSILEFFGGVFG